MKHFVLVGLLVFFFNEESHGQIPKAKEIVKKALQKHTSGKNLERFEVNIEYGKPGKIPDDFKEPNFLLMLIDSIMPTLPDSTRQQMVIEMKEGRDRLYQSSVDFVTNRFEYCHINLSSKKAAHETYSPNLLKGTTDSSKFIFGGNDVGNSLTMSKINPIVLLQLMSHDSTELNYIGKDITGGHDLEIVQVKVDGKWLEVYFDEKNYLVRSVKEPLVDMDPLIGRGPEYHKNLITYLDYSKQGNFILPALVEEMDSRSEFSITKNLKWESTNRPINNSVFLPWPSDEELIKFDTFDIGNGLFILEKKNVKVANIRSLIRKNPEGDLDVFTNLSNNDVYNQLFKEVIRKEFSESRVNNIFQIQPLHGVVSLDCFLSENDKIVSPMGRGFIAETEIRMNQSEDSVWNQAKSRGLIETFNTDLQQNNVTGFVLNPSIKSDYEQYQVSYYLPVEKVIYFEGNPYSAQEYSKNANPSEKVIYDLIKEKKLVVEKVVYSESYLDNAPLFIVFEEFEKRILSTDFSIYKKWE